MLKNNILKGARTMSQVLVVKAHPFEADQSSTAYVLDAFVKAYQQQNPNDDVTIVNLYHTEIPEVNGALLNAWSALKSGVDFSELDTEQQQAVQLFDQFTANFVNADKVIIANPLWNLNIPSRLKQWFDTITVAGKTFRYTENGPEGLVPEKKILHIQSSGSIFKGEDPATAYINSILRFLGIQNVEHLYIEGKDSVDPESAQQIIQNAQEMAVDIAQRF